MIKLIFAALVLIAPTIGIACDEPGGGNQGTCSQSAELLLSGTVLTGCGLQVTAAEEAVNLDIANGEANTLVATVAEHATSLNGMVITASSTNGGLLVNPLAPEVLVPYTLSYDGGTPLALTTTATEVKNVADLANLEDTSEVRITFTGVPTAPAGTYSDTVKFEVSSL